MSHRRDCQTCHRDRHSIFRPSSRLARLAVVEALGVRFRRSGNCEYVDKGSLEQRETGSRAGAPRSCGPCRLHRTSRWEATGFVRRRGNDRLPSTGRRDGLCAQIQAPGQRPARDSLAHRQRPDAEVRFCFLRRDGGRIRLASQTRLLDLISNASTGQPAPHSAQNPPRGSYGDGPGNAPRGTRRIRRMHVIAMSLTGCRPCASRPG